MILVVQSSIKLTYCPPSDNITNVIDQQHDILSIISLSENFCFVMDDFNIDLSSSVPNYFFSNHFARGFYPAISRPTRVTTNSASVIDNPLLI